MTDRQPTLLAQLRIVLHQRGYSVDAQHTCVDWVRRYILFHHKRHPATLGRDHVTAFLRWLEVNRLAGPAQLDQALASLLFLYWHVLGNELPRRCVGVSSSRGIRACAVPFAR